MDEIVYLTSLGSLDLYPNNNSCAFTNELVSPIQLDSNKEYEVGILSFLSPKRVPIINRGDPRCGVKIFVTSPEGDVHKSNFTPKRSILSLNMESILKAINDDIVSWLRMYLGLYKIDELIPNKEVLDWDGTNVIINRTTVNPRDFENLSPYIKEYINNIAISFNSQIGQLLGFPPNQHYPIFQIVEELNSPIVNPNLPQPTNGIEYVYIYCDIVQPTPFGGKLTNILDCFNFHTGFDKSVKNIIYRPLNVKYISSISLIISDQLGREINFTEKSSITAVLHIREKKRD